LYYRADEHQILTSFSASVIFPDPPGGGYNPQFSCDSPNHLKFKGGYQGVFTGCVYVIVMEGSNTDMKQFIYFMKQIMHKIWSFYSQEYC